MVAVDVFEQCLACAMCRELVAQIGADDELLSVRNALTYVDLAVHVRDDHDIPATTEHGVGGTLAALRRRPGCATCVRQIAAGAADFPFPEEFFNLPDGRRVRAQVTISRGTSCRTELTWPRPARFPGQLTSDRSRSTTIALWWSPSSRWCCPSRCRTRSPRGRCRPMRGSSPP